LVKSRAYNGFVLRHIKNRTETKTPPPVYFQSKEDAIKFLTKDKRTKKLRKEMENNNLEAVYEQVKVKMK